MLALVTAYGYYAYMKNLGVLTDKSWFAMLVIIACYCAGAALIMWLADRIDESGIGNGISIILFVNILSSGFATAETIVNQIKKGGFANIFFAILSVIIMVAVITLVVFITNSERRIPVQYAKRVVGRKMYGGQNSNLPLKLNMSGVMPIIFASSIVSLPTTIGLFVQPKTGSFWAKFLDLFSPSSVVYVLLFIALIIAFSYFYIEISFTTLRLPTTEEERLDSFPVTVRVNPLPIISRWYSTESLLSAQYSLHSLRGFRSLSISLQEDISARLHSVVRRCSSLSVSLLRPRASLSPRWPCATTRDSLSNKRKEYGRKAYPVPAGTDMLPQHLIFSEESQ